MGDKLYKPVRVLIMLILIALTIIAMLTVDKWGRLTETKALYVAGYKERVLGIYLVALIPLFAFAFALMGLVAVCLADSFKVIAWLAGYITSIFVIIFVSCVYVYYISICDGGTIRWLFGMLMRGKLF